MNAMIEACLGKTEATELEANQGELEAIVESYKWALFIKAMHVLTDSQGQTSSVVLGGSKGSTLEKRWQTLPQIAAVA
jgi:hypothetical protein